PLAGFFGKLIIIQALLLADLNWLAVVLVLASVVSAYYYLRVIVHAFMLDEEDEAAAARPSGSIPDSLGTVILVTGLATLALGLFTNWLYQLAVDGVGLAAL
ncbi:MAG TPA: NADH-quinone oxidoreductase subunit N, partial [Chloroflexota bacterium]|nr:NADH-quinone oxidoreductase subunit N [Chloroflexota bacterium]